MKRNLFAIGVIVAALGLASCNDNIEPIDPPVVEQPNVQRTVVYTVGGEQGSTVLKTDTEWDALLDKLMGYAQQGSQVAFYSMSAPSSNTKHATKEKTTFTTTDQTEMKEWMKKMEKEGKTVNVSYNKETGVWNGVAYVGVGNQNIQQGQEYTGMLVLTSVPKIAEIPPQSKTWALEVNADSLLYLALGGYLISTYDMEEEFDFGMYTDSEVVLYGVVSEKVDMDGNPYLVLDLSTMGEQTLVGTWQLVDLTKIVESGSGTGLTIDVYYWNTDGVPVYYTLAADGTATFTQGNEHANGTWSLSGDAQLCCDLFEGSSCWTVNWYTPETLVISHDEWNTPDGDIHYQMMLSNPDAIDVWE